MIDFLVLPTTAQARLARLSSAVSGVVPKETRTWKIKTRQLSQSDPKPKIIREVKDWLESGCLYLYTFQIADKRVDTSELTNAYAEARSAKIGERAYARPNSASLCLYVGSSEKIHQRLKEHLGFGAKGTYALHLVYWASPFDIEINFECAKYPKGTSKKAIQTLEDTLWAELLPMFGRQGSW